jgi:hypothetical protein
VKEIFGETICALVQAKVHEQMEGTENLVSAIPKDRLSWRPALPPGGGTPFRMDELLGHLLECAAGFCAALGAARPRALSHFDELRNRPRNHRCGVEEALEELRLYARHVDEGFHALSDEDLTKLIPTVFVADGEALLTLLLGNLEHLINHKHQLYFYLKMVGVSLGTADLYALRGDVGGASFGAKG